MQALLATETKVQKTQLKLTMKYIVYLNRDQIHSSAISHSHFFHTSHLCKISIKCIVFFCFMYVYLYLVAYSHLFPTCTVHNLYMEISRHFIFRNFIYSPHPHPTPYPPPPPGQKKNPRRTKNIHLCN